MPAMAEEPERKTNDLDSTVFYSARDSLSYNFDARTIELFGKAKVEYKDIVIEGPKITVEQLVSTAHTSVSLDSLGRIRELPKFTDKDGSFNAETMTYNYKTRYGSASEVTSNEELGIFSGKKVERMPSGELHIEDGIYTTCDLEEPHYWFWGKHMTIIPGDRLISRPFVMYIHPEIFNKRLPVIPIIPLPYMSVPISNKRASGFLFPRIGRSSGQGIYLSNLGYFWAINDYLDLRVDSDVSFNGSWRFGERFRYKKGELFSGRIEGEYARIVRNDPGDPDYARYIKRNLRIKHHQVFDPTARLDVNLHYLDGNRYYDINSIDPESIVTQQATSYASFSKSWDEGRRVLNAGYQRVDDLTNSDLTQKASASLYQERIYPFRTRLSAPLSDWRSRFSIQPSLSFSGEFVDDANGTSDLYIGNAGLDVNYQQEFAPGYKALFTQGVNVQGKRKIMSAQDDLNGTRIELPFTIQSTLFKYLHLTPSLTFTHYRVNSTVQEYYDSVSNSVVTQTIHQPAEYSTTVFSLAAQARLYGVLDTGFLEKTVGLKALRHTFIPTVTFTYNPDYRGGDYDYYRSYYDPVSQSMVSYNRFDQSLYSAVPEERTYVGVNLQNLIHGKFSNRDGSYRTAQLLSLAASSGYNFAASSMPLSPLVVTASSNAFSPALLFSAGAMYDFYSFDPATGERVDKLAMNDGKGLLRFVNGFLNMSVSIKGHLRSEYVPVEREGGEESLVKNGESPIQQAIFRDRFTDDQMVDFKSSLPWSLRMSLYLVSDKSNPLDPSTTALLNTATKVALSRNWQVGVNTGLDLGSGKFVYPALMVWRDLHCFQFSAQWVPSGEYKGYLVQIAMKPAQLKYLKVQAGSGNTTSGFQ
ncbi:MAG TPA: LPS-assembly protein LptD [Chlorobaculum parvum]|uniref:LPS-assembly protein LptD n=1 Tax=Chlorobaculum parvum TaxID=274539 RepID=A0A7C5DH65_9CHLB|nr:LPS-assembly protein LptD [Chlorobaculum parvum]